MSPQQHLQRLLAGIHEYEATDIVTLLPLAAAFLSALCARTVTIQQPQALPDTDYLFNADQIAQRLGKSIKWVRANAESMDFAIKVGNEHRYSARGLDDWISEQRAAKMAAALPPGRRQHER